jgi:hypothetical protein
MEQYVSHFSEQFIGRAFASIVAASTKVLGQMDVEQTDENRVKLLRAVANALEQGADWEPPAGLMAKAETKARIQYNNQVNNLLDDLESP